MEIYGDTATVYRDFADEARDSPCFREWALAVAGDEEVLAWLTGLPERKRQPNLVFAAARWHGVPAPGPYDGLRGALLGDDGSVRATILDRSTQTNEVGRLATLLPAFAAVAGGRPLGLLEVGASAGLCLFPDRYSYRWTLASGREHTLGNGSELRCPELRCPELRCPELRCTVTSGDPPLPGVVPRVAWRAGIDLAPVDVTDDDAVRWLETLVWPEHDVRRARLRSAVAIARADPPRIVRGDLLDRLPALLDELTASGTPGEDAVPVVFHSAVAAYLGSADRIRLAAMMHDLVSAGRCHWVSNEGPRVLPDVLPAGVGVPMGRFVLAVDGAAVALTHGHGAELDWLSGAELPDF